MNPRNDRYYHHSNYVRDGVQVCGKYVYLFLKVPTMMFYCYCYITETASNYFPTAKTCGRTIRGHAKSVPKNKIITATHRGFHGDKRSWIDYTKNASGYFPTNTRNVHVRQTNDRKLNHSYIDT